MFLLVSLIVFLTSCSQTISTGAVKDFEVPYIVRSVSSHSNGVAIYYCSTGDIKGGRTDRITFIDSIGKYTIGDRLYPKFIKQN